MSDLLLARRRSDQLYVDSVFSTYLYTGNGSTQTINNGIDLAGEGGLVHIKCRSNSPTNHNLFHTSRTLGQALWTNSTNVPNAGGLQSFSSSGFNLYASEVDSNFSGYTYASWTFRNAPNFYHHEVVTKSAGSNASFDFSMHDQLGMVRVKRLDASGSWYVWHRNLSAGQLLIGETTAVAATLGHVTVSGTTVTLVNGVIADGTYLVEAWAHDPAEDGIVQCGSFTTDGSGNATVELGWEPQFVIAKAATGAAEDWWMADSMRGMPATNNAQYLLANTSGAEATGLRIYTNSTGFTPIISASRTYIYLAIRRPNKPPESGAEVYNAIARTGTSATATVTGVGFAPDLDITQRRDGVSPYWFDRLRGINRSLLSATTNSEATPSDQMMAFGVDGVTFGSDNNGPVNYTGYNYINHFFRRAPGFFDVVCYMGTGVARTVPHGLGVAPELMIVKSRSQIGHFAVFESSLGPTKVQWLDGPNAAFIDAAYWNNTIPTDSVFTVATNTDVNGSGATYVAYLFATLPGISKVGNYTGNGSSQTIDCGFTTGARFILIKRTDSTGDWYVWDSARGIVSGNDPRLSLNTTAAEVTTLDTIDPATSGFIVNQDASNVNVNGAEYIFLAIA